MRQTGSYCACWSEVRLRPAYSFKRAPSDSFHFDLNSVWFSSIRFGSIRYSSAETCPDSKRRLDLCEGGLRPIFLSST